MRVEWYNEDLLDGEAVSPSSTNLICIKIAQEGVFLYSLDISRASYRENTLLGDFSSKLELQWSTSSKENTHLSNFSYEIISSERFY